MRVLVLFFGAFFLSAAVEIETDCVTLGYTNDSAQWADCEEGALISCPSDNSYKVCSKFKSEYTLSSCPDGATCEQEPKYRFEGCQDGYTLSADGKSCVANAIEKTCDDAIAEAGVLLTSSGAVEDGVTYYIKEDTHLEHLDANDGLSVIRSAYELSECKNAGVNENPILTVDELWAFSDYIDMQVYVPISVKRVEIDSYFPDFSFYRDVNIDLIRLDNCQTSEFQTGVTELNFEDDANFNTTSYNRIVNIACYNYCKDVEDICYITINNNGKVSSQVYDITSDEYPEEDDQGQLSITYN